MHLNRMGVTGAVVATGLVLVWILYGRFVDQPWTRSAQVRADVINVTSYVSGKVVQVHVRTEEFVLAVPRVPLSSTAGWPGRSSTTA